MHYIATIYIYIYANCPEFIIYTVHVTAIIFYTVIPVHACRSVVIVAITILSVSFHCDS